VTKVPSLNFDKLVAALRREGCVVVRQKGSHIRLQKHTPSEVLKLVFLRTGL
jgi:predicted RNA binding protein YcfA (HicA-like mRNA interferase family)